MLGQMTRTLAGGVLLAFAASAGLAESPHTSMDFGPGEAEYLISCAACHGTDASGSGMIAELLNVAVPDLTGLSARSGGEFPMLAVIKTIDGRDGVRAHGGPMPIWGERYFSSTGEQAADVNPKFIVQGRVLALARYLESIQK